MFSNTLKILILLSVLIVSSAYIFFFHEESLRVEVTELIHGLERIEIYGVSGDADIGISTIIKPISGMPVGLEGVRAEDFGLAGDINVFFVGDYYISVYKSKGNTPAYSSINISKPLSEGGILKKPITSMQQIESRFQELEQAFLEIPQCPKFREIKNSNGIKYKSCIFKRKNECSSNGKKAYKCMWDGINQWGMIE